MPRNRPRLRGTRQSRNAVYPLGEFPDELIHEIARHLVYLTAVGHADLSGNEWGHVFAAAVGGEHHASNLDSGDVTLDNCAWSLKTVKSSNPFEARQTRLISGRNSPTYSRGITDPFISIPETGRAVLEIWNARVDRVLNDYEDYRSLVLIRNMNVLRFSMFESEVTRFIPGDYQWGLNARENFEGINSQTGEHCFTWQPHGGQFTILKTVPASAIKYQIRRPPMLDFQEVLNSVRFDPSWVEIIPETV